MLFFLETVDVVAILLMLFMLVVILNQQPSKAQMAFVLYNVFTIIFVIGLQLELMHSDTVGEALSGLCVQYVGQAGFLMALLWFVSVFARFSIPAWIYGVQGLCSVFVLARDRNDRHNVLHDDGDAEVPLFRFVARGG